MLFEKVFHENFEIFWEFLRKIKIKKTLNIHFYEEYLRSAIFFQEFNPILSKK